MKKTSKILLFMTLLVLLVGIVSATDVSDNTTHTASYVTQAVDDSQIVSQKDTTADEIQTDESSTKTINKNNTKNLNTKKESTLTANSWDTFVTSFNEAKTKTEDTTIFLEEGTYTITGPLTWDNSNIVLTIDGNGQTFYGNQYQVLSISTKCSLLLKNITITNGRKINDRGGAISNYGNLTIINSTLSHNYESYYVGGGAIYNEGTLTIRDSTLNNNTAHQSYGGTIYNIGGNVIIIHSTFVNNTSDFSGGAIVIKTGSLILIDSILENNTSGSYGGAIFLQSASFNISNSNFTENRAKQGAAIFAVTDVRGNVTGNIFKENTATVNGETLGLDDIKIENNSYYSTDINLSAELFVKSDLFSYGEDIILNYTITLNNPKYYDFDVLNRIEDITLYINDVVNETTKYENYTLPTLNPGEYNIFFTTSKRTSNMVTFTVTSADSKITTDKESYDYYDGIKDKITLAITDVNEEKGIIDVYVKDGDEYTKLLTNYNVKDGYKLSAEALKEALENIYSDLDSSYILNVTYTSGCDFVNPSSTEFTLNLIKQRNTTIIYDIINNTEGNVQINITAIDAVNGLPIPNGIIEVTGDITTNTTSGILTDTLLTPGNYKINVKFNETTDYKTSNTTIDFSVEIDKDKKIAEMEEEINNQTSTIEKLNNTINQQTTTINTLNNTINEQLETINSLNDTVNQQVNTINNQTNTINQQIITINTLNNTVQDQTNTINSLNNTINEQLETINSLNNTVNQQVNTINNQTNTINQQITIINTLNNTINSQKNTIENLNNTINQQTATIEALNNVITTQQLTIQNLQSNLNNANNLINNLNTENNNQRNTITTQQQAIQNLQSNLNNANNQINNQQQQINQLQETIQDLTAPKQTSIIIDPIDNKVNQNINITGSVITTEGSVANAKVTVNIDGVNQTVTADSKGTFTAQAKFTTTGQKTVTVTYAATEKYKASNKKTTVTIIKNDVIITINEIDDVTYTNNAIITGKLTDSKDKALVNSNLKVTVNGKTITIKTDSKGKFKITTAAKTMGKNNVTVTYTATTYYNTVTESTIFNVVKQDIIITIDKIQDYVYGDSAVITGKVVDANRNAVYNTGLKAIVNGKTFNVKTDANGIFTITTAAKTMGTNNVTISITGNAYYNTYTTKATFQVIKQATFISVDTFTYNKGNYTIKGTFRDSKARPVINSSMKLTLNGKTINIKTDANGKYTYTGSTKLTKLEFSVSFGGNAYYDAYQGTKTTMTFA